MFLEKNLYGERVRKDRISIKNQYRGDNLKSSMRLTLQFSLLQSKQIKMSSSRRNRLRILFPTEMVVEKKKSITAIQNLFRSRVSSLYMYNACKSSHVSFWYDCLLSQIMDNEICELIDTCWANKKLHWQVNSIRNYKRIVRTSLLMLKYNKNIGKFANFLYRCWSNTDTSK